MPSGTCFVTGKECPIVHEHHVIPRQFGGVDSRIVCLSPDIHTAIHAAVESTNSFDALMDILKGEEAKRKAKALIEAIRIAQKTLPQTSHLVTISLSPNKFFRLKEQANNLNIGVPELIKRILDRLVFGENPK